MLEKTARDTYINTQRKLIYRLNSTADNSHLCILTFEFEHIDLNPLIGSVHIDCEYTTPAGSSWTDTLGFEWSYHQVYGFKSYIQDFILPIRGHGIGTFIFYVVTNNLPVVSKRMLHISGKLVQQDSNAIRDDFWKKIIDHENDKLSSFKVDGKGNGSFSGYVSIPRVSAHPKLLITLVDAKTILLP